MFDWLKSKYTKSLEKQIEEIKTAHARELDYVKNELAWHKEESERLRRFLLPTMQPVYDQVRANNDPISTEPTEKDPYAGLTPFQKLQAKDLEEQDREIAEQRERKRKESMSTKQPEPSQTK
jgi:hypothetical protein